MSSNFRYQLLSLSSLVSITAPWAAFAQVPISSVDSGSVEDRVIRLERTSNAHNQFLTQLQQQLSDNRSDIDSLHGQTQENQYQPNQVVEWQKQILLQIDSLSSGGAALQSASGDQGDVAASTTPTVDADTTNADVPVKSDDANTDCNAAIVLVQDESYQDDAMMTFQNLIKDYPDSTYLLNANYRLDQLNYSKGKKGDAAYYFTSVMKNYPKSPKAADAMFRIGIIMQDEGDAAKAKAVYQQVISRYLGTDGTRQAQKRLNMI